MKNFDVQTIEIKKNYTECFEFIAKAELLPEWTNAFSNVKDGRALLETPMGKIDIDLEVVSDNKSGIIDWYMTMPDKSVAKAQSRLVKNGEESSIYSFILFAPPVPLEQIEGTLNEQIKTLAKELIKLKGILER